MMVFGKVDCINLLPLHIYLEKYPLSSGIKVSFERKKGVPSRPNLTLYKGRIDAAIISSIESIKPKYHNLDLGVCASGRVLSVLVEKKTTNQENLGSASSNALTSILKRKGRVIIGDRALKLYLENKNHSINLCEFWYERTHLSFVFARFSCTRHKAVYKKILLPPAKSKTKVPNYILESYTKTRGIDRENILFYLERVIHYELEGKGKRALAKFTKAMRFQNKFKT